MRSPKNSLFLLNITRAIKKDEQDRKYTCKRNIQVQTRNHYCGAKACRVHASYWIVIRGLSGCTFLSTFSHKQNYIRKKRYLTANVCILIFSTKLV